MNEAQRMLEAIDRLEGTLLIQRSMAVRLSEDVRREIQREIDGLRRSARWILDTARVISER